MEGTSGFFEKEEDDYERLREGYEKCILQLPVGDNANGRREPRQVRKEAAVSGMSVVRKSSVGIFL